MSYVNIEQSIYIPLQSLSGIISRAKDKREQRLGEMIVKGVLV